MLRVLAMQPGATGRAFLAYLPDAMVGAMCDAELVRARERPDLIKDIRALAKGAPAGGVQDMIAEIRTRGYASVDGGFIPRLVALARPVLDWQDEADLVVTLIGTDPAMLAPRGRIVQALHRFCDGHSTRVPHLDRR